MKSKGSGHKYLVSRAVEEPLEATVELGENIKDISKSAKLPLRLGLFGNIMFIILLIPSIYHILYLLIRGFLGDVEVTTVLLINSLVLGLVLIFLVAITITSILYLVQIYKFNLLNLQRCCVITELTKAQVPKEEKEAHAEKKKGGIGKHLRNPIFAMLDLEEETMHVLPQIVKMLWFCVYFISVTMMFLLLTSILRFTFDLKLIFSFGLWEMALGVITVIFYIPALVLLIQSENNFRYIHTRHKIIDSIRFAKDIRVPEGKNRLKRLLKYLTENDPYIKSSFLANKAKFKENVTLEGHSGRKHRFAAYFLGVNILKEKTVSLGMPMGKFAVFIKVFKDDISLDELKLLKDATIDVCKKENLFPLRIIALQWSIKDLPDDVYEYVLENPILMKNTLTHLEVVAEDKEVYSFIPMISYGERMD